MMTFCIILYYNELMYAREHLGKIYRQNHYNYLHTNDVCAWLAVIYFIVYYTSGIA